MTRILGIDPSLTSTGAVLLCDGEVSWAERWHTTATGIDRLAWFYGTMQQATLPDDLSLDRPDLVAIEGYAYASPHTNMAAMGELGGVIRVAAIHAGIPVEVIPPATWRKELLGKGNLAKDQVRLESFRRYGVDFPSIDVLEAWAVAMTVHRRQTGITAIPRPTRRQVPA